MVPFIPSNYLALSLLIFLVISTLVVGPWQSHSYKEALKPPATDAELIERKKTFLNIVDSQETRWRDGNASKAIESQYNILSIDKNNSKHWDLFWMRVKSLYYGIN